MSIEVAKRTWSFASRCAEGPDAGEAADGVMPMGLSVPRLKGLGAAPLVLESARSIMAVRAIFASKLLMVQAVWATAFKS
jgi:hypothetical protein